MARPTTADEKRWRAEEDAYTLAAAHKVYKDPERLKAAQAKAKEMAEREAEDLAAYRSVAGRSQPPRASTDRAQTAGQQPKGGNTAPAAVPMTKIPKK